MRTSFEHWQSAWNRLGLRSNDGPYRQVIQGYCENNRAYHSLQHLEECLLAFDEFQRDVGCASPGCTELALWFHDAVYDPQANDNEEKSASMAESLMREARADANAIREVARLILLTKSHAVEGGGDDAAMIDIDLSILGKPQTRFDEYERQIQQEYAWVPEPVYRTKRAEILAGFLAREHLFRTDFFRSRYDLPARENLTRLIHTLTLLS